MPEVALEVVVDLEAIPQVQVVKVHDTLAHVNPRRRGRSVTVKCPFCRCRHVHGWAEGDLEPGVRISHCHQESRAYRIVLSA